MKDKRFCVISLMFLGVLSITTLSYAWSGEPWAPISRATITARANEMIDSTWSPHNNIYNFGYGSTWHWFYTGTTYTGQAYSQSNPQENWSEFLSYVNNTGGGNTYYGNDCSGFVSIAWRLPLRYTTSTFGTDCASSGGYCEKLGEAGSGSSVSLEQGDAFNDAGSHILLFNRYVTGGIESMEQTPWTARRQTLSWSYLSVYTPVRRNDIIEPIEGCTDPNAINYNPDATTDDGSCEYLSFNEYAGILAKSLSSQITNHYYYPWVDSMAGNKTAAWILVGNPSSAQTATVTIKLAGTTIESFTVSPGAVVAKKMNEQFGGPCEVESDINVYTTQRVNANGYLNEYAGLPGNSLANHYYYPWVDSMAGNKTTAWILVGNPSSTQTAAVTIKLAGTILENFTLNPGTMTAKKIVEKTGGPIEVESNIGIYTTQRVVFNSSFSEYAGIPGNNISNQYYYPWIDSMTGNKTTSWILVGNPSSTQTATITLTLAGNSLENFTLAPGAVTAKKMIEKIGGPLKIESNITVYTTQRVTWITATGPVANMKSFYHDQNTSSTTDRAVLAGLANHHYYPWIDSVTGNETTAWILVGNPSTTQTANVIVKFAGNIIENFTVAPGTVTAKKMIEQMGGPLEVQSDIAVYTTQRAVYRGSFNEYGGIVVDNQNENSYLLWTK
ncbi:hypothetical protein U27_06267 [Candidatus Vecturithrix granuli]|uniref:Uncharacterized protein n=1 Tax=Vecturithrix granuli TaxID=1499967 RepID=A0A081C3Y5_VECG1|nr:hypothetical protein U27_06267 [Candidatus Vecturithrix granuli]